MLDGGADDALYGLASKVCEPTDESQSDDDPPITEALFRRWLICQFHASIGGTQMFVTSEIEVSCDRDALGYACYRGVSPYQWTSPGATTVRNPFLEPTEACDRFSANEIVGLVYQ